MKKQIAYIFFLGLFMLSCKDAVEYENKVYMTGTESSDTRQLVVDGVPSEVAFSATLADLVNEATDVTIAVDNSLIDVYNSKYHKNYKQIPDGSFNLTTTDLRIEPNELRSNAAKIVVTDDSKFEEGTTYLVPVTITGVKGGVSLLEASKTIYFVVIKTIVTQACNLRGSFFFRVDFSKNNDESLKALSGVTYETRLFCTATMTANPWISSIMGLEENWLMRMGDAGNIPNNAVQVAGRNSNATGPNPIPLGEWHHVAATWNSGVVKLYIDGEEVAQTTHPGSTTSPGAINLCDVYSDPCFSIGISANATARRWNGYFSEMRVWKRALSRTEIANNMCYVDPASPGLLAYWRFNGTTPDNVEITTGSNAGTYPCDVILDVTGNGYNAIPYTNTNNALNPPKPMTTLADQQNWVQDVKCP